MTKVNFLNGIKSFKFCDKLAFWAILPLIFVIAAIVVVLAIGIPAGSISDGFNIGIDFEGGTILQVKLGDEALPSNANYQVHVDKIVKAIESNGVVVSYIQSSESANLSDSTISFRYKNISNDDAEIMNLNEKILESISALYPGKVDADNNFITYESIGKTASEDLIEKAVLAMGISLALILIYIIFRFEFISGIAAVVTMIHDIVIMFAITVICRVQINSSYIAAAITVAAYSINNTIIIFDRAREILKPVKGKKGINYSAVGDEAIQLSFTRSLFTTFTTIITVVFLSIFGAPAMREFTLPIIIGLIVGLYSSLFLAAPLWSAMSFSFEKLKEKRMAKKGLAYEAVTNADFKRSDEETVKIKKEKSETKSRATETKWVNPKKKKR